MLQIYDTKSRDLAVISTKTPVKIYACGPTVYRDVHLGNLRSFLLPDLLRTALSSAGIDSFVVQNITDVGHMVDDTGIESVDPNQDKMLQQAAAEKVSALDIARKYESKYLADLSALNVQLPDQTPRASETINEMIAVIEKLIYLDFAYQGDDGSVFFSAQKFPSYGAISGNTLDQLKPGHRFEGEIDSNKRFHGDWALWKISDQRRTQLTWDTPWGQGFPGWHIECTAMSLSAFGDQIDIHTGGIDLRFPHHENERAQSNCVSGKEVVNAWVHAEHLLFEGRKMSKSTNNVVLLSDVVSAGISPAAVRLVFLENHYRSQLNLTWETLVAAEQTIRRWSDLVDGAKAINQELKSKISAQLLNNLNTADAVISIRSAEKELAKSPSARADVIATGTDLLKINLAIEPVAISEDAKRLVQARDQARLERDWQQSDSLRDQLISMGYEVNDASSGTMLRRAILPPKI
ncbi:MAG: cysteine--tRNA ligase [Actinobacteria bacterium]|nr:cysteine--tRNA ligase [Actinomycetota bacterium]